MSLKMAYLKIDKIWRFQLYFLPLPKNSKNMATIEEKIEKQKRFIEIDKDTIAQLIEEGQDESIIECEKENLKRDEEELNRLIGLK